MARYRFQAFQFDTETWELESPETSRTLRPKSGALLCFLLENRDRLLTKDEIMNEVWGDVVVSNNTLMQGIQELRRCFGDDARNPSFIKTWHQRGYQWIYAPVMVDDRHPSQIAESNQTPETPQPVNPSHSLRLMLGLVFGLAIVGVIGLAVLFRTGSEKPVSREVPHKDPKLVFLPFANETGEPDLDWTIHGVPDLLADELNRAGLGAMSLKGKAVPDSFHGADQISGRFIRSEDSYALIWDRRNGDRVLQNATLSLARPLDGVSILTKKLLSKMPLKTTFSGTEFPRAEQAYANGIRALNSSGAEAALGHFKLAVETDPRFVRAGIMLAFCLEITGQLKAAQAQYEQGLIIAPKDPLSRFSIHRNLGRLALNQMNLAMAENHLSQAVSEAEILQIRSKELQWQHDLVQFLGGARIATLAEKTLSTRSDHMDITESRLRISSILDPTEEERVLKSDLHWYQKSGDLHNQAVTLLKIANNQSMGITEKKRILHSALDLFGSVGYRRGTARTLTDLGYVSMVQGDLQEAAENLNQARLMYGQLNDPIGEAKALFTLGINTLVGHMMGRHDGLLLAKRHFSESLAIYNRYGLKIRLMTVNHLGLGMVAQEERRISEAFDHFNKALALSLEQKSLEDYWLAIIFLMTLDMDQGHYQKALARFQDRKGKAPALCHMIAGHCYYNLGSFKAALKEMEQAQTIAEDRWRPEDENTLQACRAALETGKPNPLAKMKHPLLAYLESRSRRIINQ